MEIIGCFPFGNICIESFLSFLNIARSCPQITNIFCSTSSDAAVTRNRLVNNFLDLTDAEWALWIDTDQVFTPDDVKAIIETPGDIAVARIPARKGTHFLCGFMKGEGKYAFHPVHPDSKGLIRIDACGFGMVKVHRKVHEAMRDLHGYSQFKNLYLPEKEGPFDHQSHDIAWSWEAKQLGFEIVFNNDVKVAHFGGIVDEKEMYKRDEAISSESLLKTRDKAQCGEGSSNPLDREPGEECGVQLDVLQQ